MRLHTIMLVTLWAAMSVPVPATEPTDVPRAIPLTRPEMKQYLEDMKQRMPRIPLPALTDEDQNSAVPNASSYESRVRALYLPVGVDRGQFGFGRSNSTSLSIPAAERGSGLRNQQEPGMTLDYRFKTSLFWIVSRTNNCQYCLGHQESKLLAAGMVEDQIASLDGDWLHLTPAEQAAFAFARKITLQPNEISDADVDALRKHYTDLQILEMILSVSGNNSINRWKEGIGVPQSANGGSFGRTPDSASLAPAGHSYLTPTSDSYRGAITKVAPLVVDSLGAPTPRTISVRPPLESRDGVERALAVCRKRTARLPLVEPEQAQEILRTNSHLAFTPEWMRLVANFPQSGERIYQSVQSAEEKGDLSPLLKAQVAWIVARQDRAWYATGHAQRRLRELGETDDQIYRLDRSWSQGSATDRNWPLYTVAQKLAASPVVLTDDDVSAALKAFGPRDVVQLIHYVTTRASFNRITEAAGLQLEM